MSKVPRTAPSGPGGRPRRQVSPAGYHLARTRLGDIAGPGPVYLPVEHLTREGCQPSIEQAALEHCRRSIAGLSQN